LIVIIPADNNDFYMTDIMETISELDSSMESDSQQMCEDRAWLVKQACNRIKELCRINMNKVYENESSLPDEIIFKWYNVRNDLKNFCDEKYDNNTSKMRYSFDTIFNGGFTTKKGKIVRQRMRDAGVINPFVLDVKREMADKCIKVWDISDSKISNKKVWQITIFIHEIIKKQETQKVSDKK
tara:strand:- start:160 stop:708 length:549 start_codon:yes stop_codon:yes gene_type:complete